MTAVRLEAHARADGPAMRRSLPAAAIVTALALAAAVFATGLRDPTASLMVQLPCAQTAAGHGASQNAAVTPANASVPAAAPVAAVNSTAAAAPVPANTSAAAPTIGAVQGNMNATLAAEPPPGSAAPMATPPCVVPLGPGAVSTADARLRTRACAAAAANYTPDLPLPKLRAGVTLAAGGPGRARLRRAARRLASGDGPVRAAVIGGSITWGDGVGVRGRDDWFALFTSYLKSAFPANVSARRRRRCRSTFPCA